jgi:hypothetical protein
VLPRAAVRSLQATQIQALTRGAPGKETPGEAGSGALEQAAAGGGSAQAQVVLPRHRRAVERYFDRPAKTEK